MLRLRYILRSFLVIIFFSCNPAQESEHGDYDVIVIGDGTGAISAAIQSARSGAKTLHITSQPWLGGMLTSAGVSAIDGNHEMPAGIWGEFRQVLRDHYGGAEALATGWVSHTQFEPSVGDSVLKSMARKLDNLTVAFETQYETIGKTDEGWLVTANFEGLTKHSHKSKILIDGTDLGDVAAMVGASYDIGMDNMSDTGEDIAPEQANDIIQDLTYVAILENQGEEADLLEEPKEYDPSEFDCACQEYCNDAEAEPHPCETMMTYARLPNDKYLINWPIKGNDVYLNVIDLPLEERLEAYEMAKEKTLRFIYFIQHELGFDSLGISKNEFPTIDGLPLMPYHREGRRVHGLTRLTLQEVEDPYVNDLYKTGIAVGDYPIDHHHKERPEAPEMDFPMVPSFSIPMGTLLPRGVDNMIMADKAISVTNIVNGSSRLQPVILQVGQAAGAMAALAVNQKKSPAELAVRDVQQEVLEAGGYLMPFWDVKPDEEGFEAIQKIAAAGILRGRGEPYKWANRTWFYPDRKATFEDIYTMSHDNDPTDPITLVSIQSLGNGLALRIPEYMESYEKSQQLTRREVAIVLKMSMNPFKADVDIDGSFTTPK